MTLSPPADRSVAARLPVVRLGRHRIETAGGHRVGVALAGTGMPLVVAHGFAAQGILYAQTLSRLVSMGFMVIAVDLAGHGSTPLPRFPAVSLSAYVDRFEEALAALGVRDAILMGHSMGGRIVTELAARNPSRCVALVLVDAAVGEPWDRQVRGVVRSGPCSWLSLGGRLLADVAAVADPADPRQTAKILSLLTSDALQAPNPLRLVAPAGAMILAPGSEAALRRLARSGTPAVVVHGDADRPVPLKCARATAACLDAELVVVRGAHHSWLLNDPETLPAIFGDLLRDRLGDAWTAAVRDRGLDPATATLPEIQRAMLADNSLAAYLASTIEFVGASLRRPARYLWDREPSGRGLPCSA